MSSSTTSPTSSNTSLHRPLHEASSASVSSASGIDTPHATSASRSPERLTASPSSLAPVGGARGSFNTDAVGSSYASPPASATPSGSSSNATSTPTPTPVRPGVSPITGRLRASSRSSGSTPTFGKLNKRYTYTQHGPHGRSRSSVPAPKVLPFPDLSSRIGTASRDGSRPGSPTYIHSASHTPPHATPRGSSTDVTLSGMLGLPPGTTLSRRNSSLALSPRAQAGGVGMVAASSWDGRAESSSRRTSAGTSTSPQPDSTSPAGRSTPIVFSSSRPRAQTGPISSRPAVVSPTPVSILRTTTISPPPSPAPQPHMARTTPIAIPGGPRTMVSTPPPPPIEKDVPEPRQKRSLAPRDMVTETGQTSVVITPAPPTQPLADHLCNSFLKGECADVRLWVRKWGVAWKVHKIVLVQAGFFHSLFLGGFSENRHPDVHLASRKGKERAGEIQDDWSGENVELKFDDPNITRAAFEICLSRLYSPHPRLHFPSLLLPTPSLPLTPTFPIAPPLADPLLAARDALPAQSQLATPRLLLSLLATSIYLGYNPLIREVMAMVLRTVSPCSVGRYLGFAIGDGIGEEEWEGQDDEAAWKLDAVAQVLPGRLGDSTGPRQPAPSAGASPRGKSSHHRDSTASDGKHEDDVKVGSVPSAEKLAAHAGRYGAHEDVSTREDDSDHGVDPDETIRVDQAAMPHFYGSISNKIGEATVCWLSRWALDLLHVELTTTIGTDDHSSSWTVFGHGGIPARFIRALLSSDTFFVRSEMERYRVARAILELRRSGFEASLNSSITENDSGDLGVVGPSTLMDHVVKEEDEDDGASQREAEMWDAWEEEEQEMLRIFAEGVYYSHMSFEDLSEIAKDIDPQTHLPYAPLPVLQAAHWAAADLKARIVAHDNVSPDESAVEDQDTSELGLAVSTKDLTSVSARSARRITSRGRIASSVSNASSGYRTPPRTPATGGLSGSMASVASAFGLGNPSDSAMYHPIPGDDTFRSGAGGLLFQPTAVTATSPIPGIPGIPDLCSPGGAADSEDGGKKRAPPQGENTFFGLSASSKTALQIAAAYAPDPTQGLMPVPVQPERWSKTEPFRFSVEFWGVDKLAEKERLYSTTHFHAGSYWNVYVQTIRKKDKGTQLGIYLHRQSKGEGFPPPSCPPQAAQNEVEEAYDGMNRNAQAEAAARRREGVLEGYGQASAQGASSRERGREARSMSEGGSDRAMQSRRGRSSDVPNDREPLHRYDDQRAVLPRTGSVAANLESQALSRSFGHQHALSLGSSYGSPTTGLLHQSLNAPALGESAAISRHRAQPSSVSSTSAVLGLGTSSRAALHRAGTSTDMRRVSSGMEDDPQATYRDARRITKAYFSITCASALGTALIRFSSSPDSFTLSQSWGWKSSALRSEEYLASSAAREVHVEGEQVHVADIQGLDSVNGVKGWSGMMLDPTAGSREIGGSGSLRATVVVGII